MMGESIYISIFRRKIVIYWNFFAGDKHGNLWDSVDFSRTSMDFWDKYIEFSQISLLLSTLTNPQHHVCGHVNQNSCQNKQITAKDFKSIFSARPSIQ